MNITIFNHSLLRAFPSQLKNEPSVFITGAMPIDIPCDQVGREKEKNSGQWNETFLQLSFVSLPIFGRNNGDVGVYKFVGQCCSCQPSRLKFRVILFLFGVAWSACSHGALHLMCVGSIALNFAPFSHKVADLRFGHIAQF